MKQRQRTRRRLSTIAVATTIALFSVAAAFAPPPSSLITKQQRIISTSLQSTSSQNRPLSSEEELTIEGYSRCLSPREAKQSVKNESRQYSIIDRKPRWQKPLSLISKGVKKVITKKPKKPGSLILLRCGESKWTKTGRFTGWGEYNIIYRRHILRKHVFMCIVHVHIMCSLLQVLTHELSISKQFHNNDPKHDDQPTQTLSNQEYSKWNMPLASS